MSRLIILAVTSCILFAGCLKREPFNCSLIVDNSDSTNEKIRSRMKKDARLTFQWWLNEAGRRGLGKFRLYQLSEGLYKIEIEPIYELEYPKRFAPPVLQNKKKFEQEEIESLDKALKEKFCSLQSSSPIAESIYAAWLGLKSEEGEKVLVLFTDLWQYSDYNKNPCWNFKEDLPHPEKFYQWLKDESLVTDLRDISVYIRNYVTITSKEAARLEGFWQNILKRSSPKQLVIDKTLNLKRLDLKRR